MCIYHHMYVKVRELRLSFHKVSPGGKIWVVRHVASTFTQRTIFPALEDFLGVYVDGWMCIRVEARG